MNALKTLVKSAFEKDVTDCEESDYAHHTARILWYNSYGTSYLSPSTSPSHLVRLIGPCYVSKVLVRVTRPN